MRNITLPLGVLCLSVSLCSSAFAERDLWVQRLQQEAQFADENAVRYETTAKSSVGMEAFKQEAEAQYFRRLAQFKREIATAMEKGDQETVRSLRKSMREHEQTRIEPVIDPGNPFAPSNPRPSSLSEPPHAETDSAPGEANKTTEKSKEKGDWLNNLANETEKLAESKRSWAKDQPRKMRREIEKYADILDRLAKVQRSLGDALKQGDSEAILKGQKEIMQIRDELKNSNMGLLPNLGLN